MRQYTEYCQQGWNIIYTEETKIHKVHVREKRKGVLFIAFIFVTYYVYRLIKDLVI